MTKTTRTPEDRIDPLDEEARELLVSAKAARAMVDSLLSKVERAIEEKTTRDPELAVAAKQVQLSIATVNPIMDRVARKLTKRLYTMRRRPVAAYVARRSPYAARRHLSGARPRTARGGGSVGCRSPGRPRPEDDPDLDLRGGAV